MGGLITKNLKKIQMGLWYMIEEFPSCWEITKLGKISTLERGKFGQ